jgi:hypothetical protein
MDEVEFHAPPRESKSKRWLSFHPFSGMGNIECGILRVQRKNEGTGGNTNTESKI